MLLKKSELRKDIVTELNTKGLVKRKYVSCFL